MKLYWLIFAAVLLSGTVAAQEPRHGDRQVVRATGEATVTAKPDQARIEIGVTTQAGTAQQAVAQNASKSQAVLTQLKKLAGANGLIKTTNFSVNPTYNYPKNGEAPTITGYTANNTVEVTVDDMESVGKLIDEATQSGANNIHSIQFQLKNNQAVREQAIGEATIQAKANAEAIARALNLRVTGVADAQTLDASAPHPVPMMAMRAQGTTPATTIEPGTINARATVSVTLFVQ